MSEEIARLLAGKFIARVDAKAEQGADGNYFPTRDSDKKDIGWTGKDIIDHIEGRKTYGHYVVNQDDKTKVICFDLDVRKLRPQDERPIVDWDGNVIADQDNRDGAVKIWREGQKLRPSDDVCSVRDQIAIALSTLGEVIARRIDRLLEIPVVAAYSGSKGLHVYGLCGLTPANDARTAAAQILDDLVDVEQSHGVNFFQHKHETYSAVEIEVFPKQDSLKGGGYGNLLRLPMGVNRRSGAEGYFMQFGPHTPRQFFPMDPLTALTGGRPWPTA